MDSKSVTTSDVSRRRFLGICAGSVALAGCGGDSSDPESSGGDVLQPLAIGDPDAEVTLQVYTDYACPHCANYAVNGFPELRSEFMEPETIRYEHRDFPLPVLDPGSYVAANAAREVQAQEGVETFYEYAETIYQNYPALESNPGDACKQLANDMGLDGGTVREAGVNRAHSNTIQNDKDTGISQGVEGTPAFVVNGELVASGFNENVYSQISTAIEQAL